MSSSSSVSLASASASTATTSLGGGTFSRTSSGHDAINLRKKDYPKGKEKDALCKAMGVLFLQHRVDKLQSDVDKLENKRESSACSWKPHWKGACKNQKGEKFDSTQVNYKTSTAMDVKGLEVKEATTTQKEMKDGRARKIIVVDVSLLIYSLRTIHNWLKEGDCRVIVPMEALRSLDMLKKGDHYLNLAARKATRFLDERFASAGTADESDKVVPGLYPQKENERINCSEFGMIGKMISGSEADSISLEEVDIRQLTCAVRETMACTLFFIREYTLLSSSIATTSTPSISLGIALPPPHFDCSDDLLGTKTQCLKYAQRADGNALLRLARQFRLGDASSFIGDRLIVAPTAASWLTADASGKDARKFKDSTYRDING